MSRLLVQGLTLLSLLDAFFLNPIWRLCQRSIRVGLMAQEVTLYRRRRDLLGRNLFCKLPRSWEWYRCPLCTGFSSSLPLPESGIVPLARVGLSCDANFPVQDAQEDDGRGREASEPLRPRRCRGLSALDLPSERSDFSKRQITQEPCQHGSRDQIACVFSLHPGLKAHAAEDGATKGVGLGMREPELLLLSPVGISRASSLLGSQPKSLHMQELETMRACAYPGLPDSSVASCRRWDGKRSRNPTSSQVRGLRSTCWTFGSEHPLPTAAAAAA